MNKTELISELQDFKNKKKFGDSEWEKRGLNPSPSSVIQNMKMLINSFIDELIQQLRKKSKNQDFDKDFVQLMNGINIENYDTEEREFIVDLLFQVSKICDLKVPDELNKLLYGEAIAELIKDPEFEKSESTNFVQSFKVDEPCQNCNQPLKSLATEDQSEIEYIGIAECFNCNQKTLIHFPLGFKTIDIYNFKVLEKVPCSKENENLLKGKI